MTRPTLHLLALVLLLAACGGSQPTSTASIPEIGPEALESRILEAGRPAVVNIWASWCIPCRSEAPLLAQAYTAYADRIDFIGVAVQDRSPTAAGFIEEFAIPYENYLDENASVRAAMGGTGVPITYFISSDGTIVRTHIGVIDEQQLALQLDELVARS